MAKKTERSVSLNAPGIKQPDLTDFINGADNAINENDRNAQPWKTIPKVNEISKTFLLRFTLAEKLKADYIVKHCIDYRSLHDFFMISIERAIKKELKKLGIK